MNKNHKELIRAFLETRSITVYSFGSLPDSKTVNTDSDLGFHGSISAKTWPKLYKKIQAELREEH